MEGGYKMLFGLLFVGAILITIPTIYLSDHTMGWSLSRVWSFIAVVFLLSWGGFWVFCRKSDVSFVLAFSTGSFLVWGILALNYYLADWDHVDRSLNLKVVNVGRYPRSRRHHRQRACFVDIELQGKKKRIDFPPEQYELLKDRKTLPLELHEGLLGFPVIEVLEH